MRIKEEIRNEIVINKSRFIACLARCFSEEEAKDYLAKIKKEYSDANHVCHAYIIGKDKLKKHSSDDREPSGTAGIPILEVLDKNDIYDVIACVVRYFGGIKLGTGGLARAYSGSVVEALKTVPKTDEKVIHQYEVKYPYDLSGSVESFLRKNTNIVNLDYSEDIKAIIETEEENFAQKITDISSGKVIPIFIQDVIKEIDV